VETSVQYKDSQCVVDKVALSRFIAVGRLIFYTVYIVGSLAVVCEDVK
jgi:hypothetical protein